MPVPTVAGMSAAAHQVSTSFGALFAQLQQEVSGLSLLDQAQFQSMSSDQLAQLREAEEQHREAIERIVRSGQPMEPGGALDIAAGRTAAENAPAALDQLMRLQRQIDHLVTLSGGAPQEELLALSALGGFNGVSPAAEGPDNVAGRATAGPAAGNELALAADGSVGQRATNGGLAG